MINCIRKNNKVAFRLKLKAEKEEEERWEL